MKLKRRIWALLLSAVMILTFMPAMAFAEPGGGSQAEVMYMDPIRMSVMEGDYRLDDTGTASIGDETYDLTLADAVTEDENIAVAYKDNETDEWYIKVLAAGNTTLTATLVDENKKEYEANVDVTVYPCAVDFWTDTVDGNMFLPGSEATLISETIGDIPDDAVYSWRISGYTDDIASVEALTDDSSKAKLTVGNLPEGVKVASFEVELVITSGSDVIASATVEYHVKDEQYKLRCNGFNKNLAVGESCTVECTLLKITSDDPDGTEVEGAEYSAEGEGSLSAEQGQEANQFIITRNEDTSGRVYFSASLEVGDVAYDVADNYCEVSDVDYEISFDEDEYPDLFDNSELPMTAVSDFIGEEGYEVGFSLWIDPHEVGDEEDYIELKNEGSTKYYTVGGENDATVTLDGKTIQNKLDEYENCNRVMVKAELLRNGMPVASVRQSIYVSKSVLSYCDNEEYESVLLFESVFISDKGQMGYIRDSEHPDGEEFYFDVTSVDYADGSHEGFRIEEAGDEEYGFEGWNIIAEKAGTYDVKVTHTVYGNEEETMTETVSVTFVDERARVEIDLGEGDRASDLLPTQSKKLTANGEYVRAVKNKYGEYVQDDRTADATYKWSFADGRTENDLAVIENAGKKTATLKIKAIDPKLISEEELHLTIKLRMFYDGKQIAESPDDETQEFRIFNHYMTIESDLAGNRLVPNVRTKIDPKAYEYRYQKKADASGYEVKKVFLGRTYLMGFNDDNEDFLIEDSKGNTVQPGEYATGPFYVTRKTNDECYIDLDYEGEEGEGSISSGLGFDRMTKLSKNTVKVTGIKDRTYTGKAQTQAISVTVGDEWGWEMLDKNSFKVTYKANKNVGTATMTITGAGRYYGSVAQTFKINPKGTKLTAAAPAKRAVTVKWAKQAAKMPTARITGYQVQYCLRKDFKSGAKIVQVPGFSKYTRKITGLKSKKTYYFRVRTYMKVGKITYYSIWSPVKAARVK